MAKKASSNKLKRKRGKKFVYRDPNADPSSTNGPSSSSTSAPNPFEDHHISKRARRDEERRADLMAEYKNRNKTGEFIDKRIAEKSSKMSEEDKMRLRFLKEQRDAIKMTTKSSKRKQKFNLGDSSEEDNQDVFMGFTHKGKALEENDDFKERIDHSSGDEDEQGNKNKGQLDEQMVEQLNFGGGDMENAENQKKSRKEIYEEIIEKSKAYSDARKEMTQINKELINEIDGDFQDIVQLMDWGEKKEIPSAQRDENTKSYEKITMNLREQAKLAPAKLELTEKEKAKQRRDKLQQLHDQQQELEAADKSKKREQKQKNKRDQAIDKIMQEQKQSTKNQSKSDKVIDEVVGKKDKKSKKEKTAQVDSDLASDEESDEDDSEQDYDSEEGELEEYDEEMGEDEQEQNSDKQSDSDSEAQEKPKGKVKLRQVADSSDDDSDQDDDDDHESGEIDIMDAGYGSEDDEEEMEEMIYDSEDEEGEFEHDEDLSGDDELLSDESEHDSFEDRHGVPRFEEVTSEDLNKDKKNKNKKDKKKDKKKHQEIKETIKEVKPKKEPIENDSQKKSKKKNKKHKK